ncbi:hypothetical protein CYMTET_26351, partial [Cymbomonas tetramitiformis]
MESLLEFLKDPRKSPTLMWSLAAALLIYCSVMVAEQYHTPRPEYHFHPYPETDETIFDREEFVEDDD